LNAQLLVENQSLIAVDSIRASVDCIEHGRINQAKRGTFYVAGGCTENNRAHASIKAIWWRRKKIICDNPQWLLV